MHHRRQLSRDAFDDWLRTGRVPVPMDYKFNGWHDPDDGKFTHVGAGRYFPPSNGMASRGVRVAMARRPSAEAREGRPKESFSGGSSVGFGGGGATDSWGVDKHPRSREQAAGAGHDNPLAATPQSAPHLQSKYLIRRGDTLFAIARREQMTVAQLSAVNDIDNPDRVVAGASLIIPAKIEEKPGWVELRVGRITYQLDHAGRTRVVDGHLGNESTGRSKTLQARAGEPNRRTSDDGGHFIAPRFGGPREAYNHFAQNAKVNRGAFRVLEDRWSKAQKGGKDVRVKIRVRYPGDSRRPDILLVGWATSGNFTWRVFRNEAGGKGE